VKDMMRTSAAVQWDVTGTHTDESLLKDLQVVSYNRGLGMNSEEMSCLL
jgi:hypothetical protein